MKILGVRSIPLSDETQTAWKSTENEFKFLHRDRDVRNCIEMAEKYAYDAVLNLGNLSVPDSPIVITPAATVRMLRDSKTVRESVLGGFLPPKPLKGDTAWKKQKGYGGVGKEYVGVYDPAFHKESKDVEYQRHIDGVEYRVITVGDKVVQVQKRVDNNPFDPAVRDYEWVGLQGSPKSVKQFAKHVASMVEGFNVIGWDVILADTGVYLLEGNTSPGVNDATAKRILDEIRKVLGLGDVDPLEDIDNNVGAEDRLNVPIEGLLAQDNPILNIFIDPQNQQQHQQQDGLLEMQQQNEMPLIGNNIGPLQNNVQDEEIDPITLLLTRFKDEMWEIFIQELPEKIRNA